MATSEEIRLIVNTEVDRALKDMRRLNGQMDKSTKKGGQVAGSFGAMKAAAIGVAASMAGVVTVLSRAVKAGAELEETNNKFNVTFSKVAKTAQAASKELQEAYLFSEQGAKDALSSTGDLLTGLGVTQDRAVELSLATAKLGADLASFTNDSGGAAGATEALTAAMLGERERAKSLGLVLNETNLKKFAEEQGIAWEAADQGTKAMITLQAAMAQSPNAIGDVERSMQSYTNQMRMAENTMADAQARIGSGLLPALKLFLGDLNESRGAILDHASAVGQFVGKTLTGFKIAIDQITIWVNVVQAKANELFARMAMLEGKLYAKLGNKRLARAAFKQAKDFSQAAIDATQAQIDARQRLSESTRVYNEYDREQQKEHNELENEQLKADQEKKNEIKKEAKEKEVETFTALEAKMNKFVSGSLGVRADAYSSYSSFMLNNLNKNSKTQFKIWKAFSIQQAIIDTYKAANAAYAALAGIPIIGPALGAAAAASAVGVGMMRVNQIRKTKFKAAATGALVRGTPGGTPLIAGENSRDEVVMPLENDQVMDRVSQKIGGGNVTVNINGGHFYGERWPKEVAKKIDTELYKLLQDGKSSFAAGIK